MCKNPKKLRPWKIQISILKHFKNFNEKLKKKKKMLTETWKLFKAIKLIVVLSIIQLQLYMRLHIPERHRRSVEHTLASYRNQQRNC